MTKYQREDVWTNLSRVIANDLLNVKASPQPRKPIATGTEVPEPEPDPEALTRVAPALDDGPVPLGSPFYVERDADRRVLAHLTEPGSTVTIKGHGKSGKSSLLARLRAWAREQGWDSCVVNFQGLEAPSLCDAAALFREIAQVLADRLGLNAEPADDWSAYRTYKTNLSRFVERRVLSRSSRPVLLLFDGADLVFPHRTACEDLFSTLRFWHNERANDLEGHGWDRLGLVVAHATDPALWIRDLNQSPFNVGLRVVLDDFDTSQLALLNERYGRPLLTPEEIDRLGTLVGGHPYLARIAFYEMTTRSCNMDELERIAARQDGPFASPLRFLTSLVHEDEPLRQAVRSILNNKACDDESMFQRLWAVGLIRGETPRPLSNSAPKSARISSGRSCEARCRSMGSNRFYKVGGTLSLNDPSYVERSADAELIERVSAGEFCFVLTTRQMGKSSLMVRTAKRLKDAGALSAIIDLSSIGANPQSVTTDQWYFAVADTILNKLGHDEDITSWWSERSSLPAVQRLFRILRDVVLKLTSKPVVLFFDEIDSTLNLPFRDDFFASLRACHNARAEDPELNRLTFVLLGVASPSDLIADPMRTPFNVGSLIPLTDFTPDEARSLADGLGGDSGASEAALRRVLEWTDGHPYLTQKVCQTAVESARG